MEKEEPLAYIGRKSCGCIVLAIVDVPEHKKDTAKELAKAIRDGLTIERVTVEFVRKNMFWCDCDKKRKDIELPWNTRKEGK